MPIKDVREGIRERFKLNRYWQYEHWDSLVKELYVDWQYYWFSIIAFWITIGVFSLHINEISYNSTSFGAYNVKNWVTCSRMIVFMGGVIATIIIYYGPSWKTYAEGRVPSLEGSHLWTVTTCAHTHACASLAGSCSKVTVKRCSWLLMGLATCVLVSFLFLPDGPIGGPFTALWKLVNGVSLFYLIGLFVLFFKVPLPSFRPDRSPSTP